MPCSTPSPPLNELAGHVERSAQALAATALLVFDHGGITGHPDHQRATDAALTAAPSLGIPVLAWAIPASVAEALNDEFGASFAERLPRELDITLIVDRTRQLQAIECHHSQSHDNPVLRRRLQLLRDTESLRYLHPTKSESAAGAGG